MNAIAIDRGGNGPRLFEVPRPDPGPGEALVRTLRVGIDGTDREVIEGTHGGFPAGEDYMIMGHEAVGVVADPNDTDLEAGEVVVPTVRRPPGEGNEYFERGEAHMAPPDKTLERGIASAHGFMSEYFTSHERELVPIPTALAPLGFLVEPISISEKALEFAYTSRSSFSWQPEVGFVLGNGSLGLLTVASLGEDMAVYCAGRRDRPDPTIEVVESLGATYVDTRETPVAEFAEEHRPADLVFEATGYAKHATASVHALGANGVSVLLGLPDSWEFEVDGGALHEELVMHNKAMLGSVNSGREHLRAAADRLAGLPESFLADLVTTVTDYREFGKAFDDGPETIKTAIEFDQL